MAEQLPDSTHAKLSASGAHRWMACPGSARLSEGAPRSSSFYAAEGTFAHHIAAECLSASPMADPDAWLGEKRVVDGHEVECTQEMIEAVIVYIGEVDSYARAGDTLWVETDLTPALRELHPDFGGTADAIVFSPGRKTLRVYDYKHGAGVPVEVEGNTQLRYYALGALLSMGDEDPAIDIVEVCVVQPRCGHEDGAVRIWSFDSFDLLDFIADLTEAAEKVYEPDPPLAAGPHCKFCPAVPQCPELERHQEMVMADEFENLDAQAVVSRLSPEKVSAALEVIPLLEARISQIRELAYNQAMSGSPPPGWKLVEKRATRKYADEKELELTLETELSDDDFDECLTPRKLKSPAQLEKALGKTRYEKFAAPLVTKQSSGHTLVPESDKRPPAQLAAPDDFEKLDG